MLPHNGQGGSQSIEDAYTLARCLAAYFDNKMDSLERYLKIKKSGTNSWTRRWRLECTGCGDTMRMLRSRRNWMRCNQKLVCSQCAFDILDLEYDKLF